MRFLLLTLKRWRNDYRAPAGRTGQLFLQSLHQIRERTDKLFYYLLLVQYPAAIAVALIWSPLAWSGARSAIHFHVWLAVIFGGILTSLPVYLIRTCPAAPITRHVVAVAQMLMGSLLIHLSGGRIETHFHVFGSLAFIAFYQDLRVLTTATAVVGIDHLLRGVLFPESIYGIVSGGDWRFVEHVFWVVFEDTILALACVQGRAQLSKMASQQAQLEDMNEKIEKAVRVRTQELSLKSEELAAARDAAMESTRLKSQFLANVSHEIRTPMNGVLGMTSLLLETNLSQDQRDYATTVQRSGEGLLTIINDILDFSKIEAGKLILERLDFILGNEIEDVVRLLAGAAEQKNIELVCEVDPALPSVVTGDAGRLRQVLVNLVGNAIKFTEKGEVTIRANIAQRNGKTDRIRFAVADTGIGITEQARKNLFQAFVQVDGSTTRKHEGTGLGLAISKEIVHLMGGEIGLESIAGAGSTFWFEVPLEVVSSSEEANLVQWSALKGLRVLIVDDNATNRKVLRRMAEAWGMPVEEVSGAQQALALLESAFQRGEFFDVALLDLQMPGMDGIELARAIRKHEYLQSIQLLLLTSLGQKAVCNSLKRAGIAACMVKPVRREHLFLTMARVCERSSQTAEGGSDAPPQAFPARRLSILIAEDNPVNQKVLTRMLKRLGHDYRAVMDGRAAIEAVQTSDYDAVLMDCQMPGMDGIEAVSHIRRLSEPTASIPVIAVTANAMGGDRDRCLEAGMTGYLTKPIRMSELAEALDLIQAKQELAA